MTYIKTFLPKLEDLKEQLEHAGFMFSKLDKDVIDLNNKLKAQLKRYKCPEEEYTIFDLPCDTSDLKFHFIGIKWEKLKEEYAQKTTD
jgi:hypothetical protein